MQEMEARQKLEKQLAKAGLHVLMAVFNGWSCEVTVLDHDEVPTLYPVLYLSLFSHWSIHCLGNLLVLCLDGEGFSELDSCWIPRPRNWVNLGWVVSCCTRLVIWHNWWENPPTFSWENPPNYDDDFPISYVKLPEGSHLCFIALWEGIQSKATKECRVSIGLVMYFWSWICFFIWGCMEGAVFWIFVMVWLWLMVPTKNFTCTGLSRWTFSVAFLITFIW